MAPGWASGRAEVSQYKGLERGYFGTDEAALSLVPGPPKPRGVRHKM